MKSLTRVCQAALIVVVITITTVAFAGNTWDGGGGNDLWGTGDNWSPDGAPPPGAGNDLFFGGTTRLTPNNNYTSYDDWRHIFFNSGAGSFSITGNAIDLYGKIENSDDSLQTITLADIRALAAIEFNPVQGNLTIGGPVDLNTYTLNVWGDNGHTLTLNGIVSGSGSRIVVKQDSRVVFNAANTYTGNTEIDAGQIRIGLNGDITTSTIYLGNGSTLGTDAKFFLNSDADGKTFSRTINVNPGDGTSANREIGFLSATTSDVGTFSGNISRSTGGDNHGLSLYSAGGRAVFSGVISGDDVVILTGPGVVQYNNAMTYTGDTSIRRGELRVSQGASIAGGTIFVGDATLPTETATLTISDADGGTTVARTLQVNNGSGAQYRVIGGSNTSGVNTFSANLTLQGFAQLTAAAGGTVDFGGDISGATFGITKVGSGTVRLSGNNTYTGQTSIDDGTLQLGASDRISNSSALYIASGATLNLNNFTEEVGNFVASAGNVTNLVSGQQFRVNQSSAADYSGSISGTGDFVKKGTATLALSGVNSYSGSTFIDAGELRYAANQASGYTGTINLGAETGSDAAVLAITNSGVTISNPITVRSNGTGARSIIARNTSGLATFAGAILVSNVLNVTATSGGNLTLGGDITMHAHNITNNTTSTTTFGGQISGTGKIVKQGTGTLTLGGNNLYTGNTEIDLGTLAVTGDIANGSTTYIGHGVSGGNATLALAANGVNLGGNIQVNTGTGTRTIDSTATSGNTTISGAITANQSTTVRALSGSDLDISGNINIAAALSMTITSVNQVTLSGAFTGAIMSQLIKAGSGTLTLSGSGANSGIAQATVNSGVLELGKSIANGALDQALSVGDGVGGANADIVRLLSSNQISDTSIVFVNSSGLLDLNGFNETVGRLAGNGNVTLGGGTLTVTNTLQSDFLGTISGAGNLVKNGADILVLSNANTYTGDTYINAGNLRVGINNALPTGTDVILADNASAMLGFGSGVAQTISSLSGGGASGGNVGLGPTGALTVNGSGNTTFSGVISGGGSLTKSGNGSLTLTRTNTYSGVTQITGGTLTINANARLSASSTVTITNTGNLVVNGTVGNVTINNGGFLKGSGTVGTLVVNAGGSFSPGNSPGTTAAGNTTWAGAGSYIWEFNDFDAAQGTDPGWDFLNITGTLTITATSGNPFNIDITSLTLGNLPGLVHDFDATATQTWVIATASGGVSGFVADRFNLNFGNFQNPYSGTWSIEQAGSDNIQLRYEGAELILAVPEPSMAILMVVGAGVIYVRRRRSRK